MLGSLLLLLLLIYLFLDVLSLHCSMRTFLCLWRDEGAALWLRSMGFSLQWLLLLQSVAVGVRASAVVERGLSGFGSQALEHRLGSCGVQA